MVAHLGTDIPFFGGGPGRVWKKDTLEEGLQLDKTYLALENLKHGFGQVIFLKMSTILNATSWIEDGKTYH